MEPKRLHPGAVLENGATLEGGAVLENGATLGGGAVFSSKNSSINTFESGTKIALPLWWP